MKRCCLFPRSLTYRTVRRPSWTVRYKRCANCGSTSKTIQRGFTDERVWWNRDELLLDGADKCERVAIIERVVSHSEAGGSGT